MAYSQIGAGGETTPAGLMTFFAQQCKDRMHLILAFSPLGSNLRESVRYFPSLINCCTIDWFEVGSIFIIYSYLYKRASQYSSEKWSTVARLFVVRWCRRGENCSTICAECWLFSLIFYYGVWRCDCKLVAIFMLHLSRHGHKKHWKRWQNFTSAQLTSRTQPKFPW